MMAQFYLSHRAITPSQSRPESNANEGVLHIPQTLRLEPYYQMHFSLTHNKIWLDLFA